MTAFVDVHTKTPEGRNTKKPNAVPPVEDVVCPQVDRNHMLTNDRHGNTRCVYCGNTWAELDAEVRG